MISGTIRRVLIFAWLATLLPAMPGALAGQDGVARVKADLLWYEEQEPGTEVYPVRIIVTRGFIRVDDAGDAGDFVLLDRATNDMYSVSTEERSILEIRFRHLEPKLPDDLVLEEALEQDEAAPLVAGKRPLLVSLAANGSACYHVAAVPGLLEEAVAGLADYARVVGNRQFGMLKTVPAAMQTPCFLARHVYAPDRHLRHGLPIQEWDGAGYRRVLVNYEAGARVDPALFRLPEDYRRIPFAGY